MPRQNSSTLSSASDLRALANVARGTATLSAYEGFATLAAALASALDQAQDAIESLEQRLRELSRQNVQDPRRLPPILVSGDRLRGDLTAQGLIIVSNANAVPTANQPAGGVIYVTAGALTYRGSAGTVTPIAPA